MNIYCRKFINDRWTLWSLSNNYEREVYFSSLNNLNNSNTIQYTDNNNILCEITENTDYNINYLNRIFYYGVYL